MRCNARKCRLFKSEVKTGAGEVVNHGVDLPAHGVREHLLPYTRTPWWKSHSHLETRTITQEKDVVVV